MNKDQKLALTVFTVGAVATAGITVLIAMNREKLQEKFLEIKSDFNRYDRVNRMDEMTEEVAMKTAKLTHNPKINQEWVERQWDMI